MFWTPSCIRSFFNSFKWWQANYLNFSPLFIFLMSFNFLYFSIIIPLRKICLSSFCLWAHIMAIRLLNLFLCIYFFVLHYSLNVFPSCFFPYSVNNTHIFDLAHVVPFVFVHFCLQVGLYGVGSLALQIFGLNPFLFAF